MEAKDTLLTPEEMVPMKHKWEIRDAQAEISFKAGIREQLNICLSELTKADGGGDLKTLEHNITELIYEWRAKLKE